MSAREYFDFLKRLETDAAFCIKYLSGESIHRTHPTYDLCVKTISKDAKHSLDFARSTKSRFELGEAAIATDARCSLFYARQVLKGRFELGEQAIAESAEYSYEYALNIIRGRFELGEKAIAQDERFAYNYAINVIKGKLPEEMHNVMIAKSIAA